MTENIMRSIAFEIEVFKHTRKGNPPEKIFVSLPLFYKIQSFRDVYLFRNNIVKLFDIPVQPYPCDEEEYYLSEAKGKFRTFADDIELIFQEEGADND